VAQLEPGLLDEIAASAADLHSAGALSPVALRAIVRHLAGVDLRHSLETGSGATTLLLSRLSPDHTVFALDDGNGSITRVKSSPLFDPSTTKFIEGPTQITLPKYSFSHPLQAAILDGPHAFPFPALEYYYIYPRLSTGALLVVDDIQIPSVHDFFRFLKADEMFEWIETVQRTAFFRRTSAEVFNPTADDWWLQGYNKIPLRRFIWRDHLRGAIPERLRRTVKFSAQGIHGWALSASAGTRLYVRVDSPKNREIVDDFATVRGAAVVPPGTRLWLLARRKDVEGWWPQGGSAVHIENDQWQHPCTFGTAIDAGSLFEIAALAVNQRTHSMLERWVTEGARTGSYAPLRFPDSVLKPALRIVQRRA
jgi:hypothetical protein